MGLDNGVGLVVATGAGYSGNISCNQDVVPSSGVCPPSTVRPESPENEDPND
jgi:hypothetical protein